MSKQFILVTWGGIGDLLVCTPTLKALRETYPDHKIIVYCLKQKKEHVYVLQNNPYITSLRTLHWTTMLRYPYHLYLYLFRRKKAKYYSLDFQLIPLSYIYDKSVKEIVPDIFNIKLNDTKVSLFLTTHEEQQAQKRLLPYKNVVLMHITSVSSRNHLWPHENWVELVRQLPEYTFIQLGLEKELYVEGAVDWRGKTTLREVFGLMKYASSFVGIESCLAHITNAFDTPGVVLFGDSSPVHWGHSNNINIYKDVSCGPCYYYLWGQGCPYGNKCMKQITVGEVKQALLQQMSKRKMVCPNAETPATIPL